MNKLLVSLVVFALSSSFAFGVERQVGKKEVTLANGDILAVGGFEYAGAKLYDSANSTWITTGPMSEPRGQSAATLLADGRVLVTGGDAARYTKKESVRVLASAEIYDPSTRGFSSVESMGAPRMFHQMALLDDGRVLVVGGADDRSFNEIYDPATGSFAPTGASLFPRGGHTLTKLRNGKVLVVGGGFYYDDSDNVKEELRAELYDPQTGKFTYTGTLHHNRAEHIATLLPNGKVLVAGGMYLGVETGSAELYDPATGEFTETGSMAQHRVYFTATPLKDGRVIMVGGSTDVSEDDWRLDYLDTTEIYDPSAGTFKAGPMLQQRRSMHIAALLPDGSVLVNAGFAWPDGDVKTTEVLKLTP